MLRHVAAGIDGSPESLAAAHWAAREAVRRGTALRLVHAWKWQPRPTASVPADMSQRAWAEETLSRVSDTVHAGHSDLLIIGDLLEDTPVTALLAAAGQADLLVLGSRGISGAAGFLTGSVSQRVVARSMRTVVLVRAGRCGTDEHFCAMDGISPEEIPETPYRDVVLGLDTEEPCDELIEFAFDAARRRAAPLRVIHAFGGPSAYAAAGRLTPVDGPQLLAEQERFVVGTLRPWCEKFPEVAVTETVAKGRAASLLIRASADAGLVVVGRRMREARFGTHIGSVAHAVLHHAPSPVAVVPHV
ncbi:universal stress protein [Streptomyces sp. NPDC002769]|uniref:universal stress protein n=1 Tax=Streptomyces sp. NPDC002769 TaxID=3154542 RepID=UPI00331C7C86